MDYEKYDLSLEVKNGMVGLLLSNLIERIYLAFLLILNVKLFMERLKKIGEERLLEIYLKK